MIETIFVLSIIIMLSSLTMLLPIQFKKDEDYIKEISYYIYLAQMNAINYKETTTVSFSNKTLSIDSEHLEKELSLDKDRSFESYQFTYNEAGHIKTAKTVRFYGEKTYSFVFQVGSGCFYVKQ